MSDIAYHNSPFAPHPYEDMQDYKIEFAFCAKEGVIATVTDTDNEMFPIPFFAPRQSPDRFYELNYTSYEGSYSYQAYYGLETGVHSPARMFLLIGYFNSGWLKYTDEDYYSPRGIEDGPHDLALHSLSEEEKNNLEGKMKSGEVQFFSLPQDSFVYSLYSVPDDGTSALAGTIAICRKNFYHHQYQALYVPHGKSGNAQSIAFYDGENRLGPAHLDSFPLHRRGVLDVTLDDGEKFAVDFSRAVYHWGEEKEGLAKTLGLPCVPSSPTPLVTPLTAKDIFGDGRPSPR